MLDCNVYILMDKERKAIKVGITRKHPDVRTAAINREATKYEFELLSHKSMTMCKARWVEDLLLKEMESLGGMWIEDDDFGGSTEVALFDVTENLYQVTANHLVSVLEKLSQSVFQEQEATLINNNKEVFVIPIRWLSAKVIRDNDTGAVFELELFDKILLFALKENPDSTQQELADFFGLSRHTVLRSIGKLKDLGAISVQKVRGSSGATYNNYIVGNLELAEFSMYK